MTQTNQQNLPQDMELETLAGIDDFGAGRTVDGDEVLAWLKSWGTSQELPSPLLNK